MISKLSDNRVTYGIRLSDRIWKDNNGQLICRDCIIARTGSYDYLESEIVEGGDENKVVKVFRTDDEVFSPISMASFENKPLCNDHPSEDVTPENYRELQCGFMRNIRRGHGEHNNCLICDVVVTDPEAIELIESGDKRELSLGYSTDIVEKDGKYYMTKIRGNHLALVNSGRAGCATIRDSAERFKKSQTGGNKMFGNSKKKSFHLFDEDIIEVEELTEEPATEETLDAEAVEAPIEEPTLEEEQVADDEEEITLASLNAKLDAILGMLTKKAEEVSDEELPVEETEPEVVDSDEDIEEITEDCGTQDGEGCAPEDCGTVEDEDMTEDCGTKDSDEEIEEMNDCGQLLDADELLPEEKVTDSKAVKKTRDAKSVYSKFVGLQDTATHSQADIEKSWQARYDRCANKN